MNTSTIFLQETIQRNDLKVNLYILKLPAQPLKHQQLIETVKENSIKIIFYFGTQSLVLKNQSGINIQQVNQDEKALQNMQDELINNKSNIGLMCSETCEISLQMYFHYMVKIEKKNLKYFQNHAYWNICPIDQLTQLYQEIYKSQNINIFAYNLLKTNSRINSNINSEISNDVCQSQIITQEQPINEQNGSEFFVYNSQIANQQPSNILPSEDQVISEVYLLKSPSSSQVDPNLDQKPIEILQPQHLLKFDNKYQVISDLYPPKSPPSSIVDPNLDQKRIRIVQPQHLLKFDNKYELPHSIRFIPFITQDGFRCLE